MAKANFNPDQPRDEDGKWTEDGAATATRSSPTPHASKPSLAERLLGISPAEAQEEDIKKEDADPAGETRSADFNQALDTLRLIDPRNRQLTYVTAPNYVPSQADIDVLNAEIERVRMARDEAAFKQEDFSLPKNSASHLFGARENHMEEDTPENRQLLFDTAKPQNLLGVDDWGNQAYTRTLPDGRQAWVIARNNVIRNGGINSSPYYFDRKLGLIPNQK